MTQDDLLVRPFPQPGPEINVAYRELFLATEGTVAQRRELGDPALLPRPWDPSTCHEPGLRQALWYWLADVVVWLNREHTWDVRDAIPSCWIHHPHLVRDVAVLADQRRAAALATTSGLMEEWQHYALPAFTDRLRSRIRAHCDTGHQEWPGRGAHRESLQPERVTEQKRILDLDLDANPDPVCTPRRRSVGFVDLESGELLE